MLVVSDGDIVKNQVRNGRPLELGYDKWTNNYYGNKEFLINSLNYLLDDGGLINIRNKRVTVPFLDEQKIAAQKTGWQILNHRASAGADRDFRTGFHLLEKARIWCLDVDKFVSVAGTIQIYLFSVNLDVIHLIPNTITR